MAPLRRSILCLMVAASASGCTDSGAPASKTIARACSPPRAYWEKPHPFGGLAMFNRVSLDHGGAIYWAGEKLSLGQFAARLAEAKKLNPQPLTFLETEAGTPCAMIEAVRDEMDRRLKCKTGGLCAEGLFDVWRNLPMPPGTPPS